MQLFLLVILNCKALMVPRITEFSSHQRQLFVPIHTQTWSMGLHKKLLKSWNIFFLILTFWHRIYVLNISLQTIYFKNLMFFLQIPIDYNYYFYWFFIALSETNITSGIYYFSTSTTEPSISIVAITVLVEQQQKHPQNI